MRTFPMILSALWVVLGGLKPASLCPAQTSGRVESPDSRVAAETFDVTVEFDQAPVTYAATVVATLKSGGKPVKGRNVTFEVVSGPHLGWPKVTKATDSKGQARSTYLGDGNLGSDSVFVQAAGSAAASELDAYSSKDGPWRECRVKWQQQAVCDSSTSGDLWSSILCAVIRKAGGFFDRCTAGSYAAVGRQILPIDSEDEREILELMCAVRDSILSQDEPGRQLTQLWYRHSPELIQLGLESPALLVQAHDFLHRNRGTLEEIVHGGRGRIQIREIESFEVILDQFAERASPALKEALTEVERMVKDPQALSGFRVQVE